MARDMSSMPALPGFDDFLRRDIDRAGAMDMTGQQYTAVRIRRDYPGTYESVARALFFYKLPVNTCADLFHMNTQCVSAIRDQVIAASAADPRAAFLVQSRRHSQRDIVLSRLTEAIAVKLSDEDVVDKMSVGELTAILEKLEKAPPARNGTDRPAASVQASDDQVIDVSQFDDVLNGLDADKKSAAIEGSDAVGSAGPGSVDQAAECSTTSTDCVRTSFGMSNRNCITAQTETETRSFDDVCDSLCKSLCGSADSAVSPGSAGADLVTHVPRAALTTPGAGGRPAPARGPGSTNNASEEEP